MKQLARNHHFLWLLKEKKSEDKEKKKNDCSCAEPQPDLATFDRVSNSNGGSTDLTSISAPPPLEPAQFDANHEYHNNNNNNERNKQSHQPNHDSNSGNDDDEVDEEQFLMEKSGFPSLSSNHHNHNNNNESNGKENGDAEQGGSVVNSPLNSSSRRLRYVRCLVYVEDEQDEAMRGVNNCEAHMAEVEENEEPQTAADAVDDDHHDDTSGELE